MLELLEMSIRKRTLQVEPIVKKRESNFITTPEITDFLRESLDSKSNKQRVNKK